MTDHASLRAALAGGAEFDDMTIITVRKVDLRTLLADHDRLRKAAKELADWVEYEVGASREESPGLAEIRAALTQEGS